ncbi:MAG: ATP-binding cassette domain-containing protein, partial [Eggerthellales bacterium]|nr:ATP-binding cassette domain-containing protein [Eggerthellales bacterium]
MQLAFDQVSFAYDVQAVKRGKNTSAPTADWGNSPSSPWALQDISFCVNEGDFFGIAGHTGSGKSTLVQHMNGL